MKKQERTVSDTTRNTLLAAISIAFLIAIFVCILCDYVITRTISWSLYPTGACVFAWAVLLPLIKAKRRGALYSMCVFTVLTLPLLALIESLASPGSWFAPLGVPIAAVSLAYLWIAGALLFCGKLRLWQSGPVALVLSAPLAAIINGIVSSFVSQPFDGIQMLVNSLGTLIVAAFWAFLGYVLSQKSAS